MEKFLYLSKADSKNRRARFQGKKFRQRRAKPKAHSDALSIARR
ncbi:hypothetical protein [Pseudaminobacter salicylatoxidans]|nr:hypothetical protein [Pseudaminobacter salicylatoxidans]